MLPAAPNALPEHLARLRVAVYASGGAPSHHLALLALWGAAPRVLHVADVEGGALETLDVVIVPGGGLNAVAGQLRPLGPGGAARLREWVERGGTYVGSCAGSCHPLRMSDPYLEAVPVAASLQMCSVTPVNASAGPWGLDSPGTGRLRIAGGDDPLLAGLPDPFEVVHYNGPLFPAEPGAAGRVLGPTGAFTPFERSSGLDAAHGTLERVVRAGAHVAYRAPFGEGRIVLFGSHPEFGASALQLGWLPAARLLANALLEVRPRGLAPWPDGIPLARAALELAALDALDLEATLAHLEPLGAQLPASTPPFLGLEGPELWRAAVREARAILVPLAAWLRALPASEGATAAFLLDAEPRPDQDFGFAGARQLLRRALEMTRTAKSVPPDRWPAFTGAYDQFLDHPYHLVASVYLSAGGLVAAAALQATAFAAANRLPDPRLLPPAAA